jgi:alkylhydroperoxidase family enzyme
MTQPFGVSRRRFILAASAAAAAGAAGCRSRGLATAHELTSAELVELSQRSTR